MRHNKINQRQLMLNAFYQFFWQTGQHINDIDINYSDVQAMSNTKLKAMFNAFLIKEKSRHN